MRAAVVFPMVLAPAFEELKTQLLMSWKSRIPALQQGYGERLAALAGGIRKPLAISFRTRMRASTGMAPADRRSW
ncbi:hypothetical protein AHiyo8_41530 [Arthrobacter sp. Hiyo8]|nr:hypothetical protein AHiyo8_41530 [Arthrobacter sp. Hiyo8]